MYRHHDFVPSKIMGRNMHIWRFGHFGPPLLVFPSASGMAHEWEAHGMVDALADLLEGGRLKLYCTESNVSEAWTRKESDPRWRIQRHIVFEQYVVEELSSWIREDCQSKDIPIGATGTSLGAFYSANVALKYPSIFGYALCMSGRYEMTGFTSGLSNLDVYFNNPMAYVSNLHGEQLERIRRHTHLILVCGKGKWEDGNVEETLRLADLLGSKGISHECDIWGHDAAHEWDWWRRQARHHLGRRLGSS